MPSFTILAVRDISKSSFSESEFIHQLNTNSRNLEVDTPHESTELSHNLNETNSNRCLKFVLRPIIDDEKGTNFVTAVEFKGHLSVPNQITKDFSRLEGAILDINTDALDIARDIILLHANQCSFRIVNNTAGDEIKIENDLIDEIFNEDELIFI